MQNAVLPPEVVMLSLLKHLVDQTLNQPIKLVQGMVQGDKMGFFKNLGNPI